MANVIGDPTDGQTYSYSDGFGSGSNEGCAGATHNAAQAEYERARKRGSLDGWASYRFDLSSKACFASLIASEVMTSKLLSISLASDKVLGELRTITS
jgi:hypothetical protein